jgi:hypothetical protein
MRVGQVPLYVAITRMRAVEVQANHDSCCALSIWNLGMYAPPQSTFYTVSQTDGLHWVTDAVVTMPSYPLHPGAPAGTISEPACEG